MVELTSLALLAVVNLLVRDPARLGERPSRSNGSKCTFSRFRDRFQHVMTDFSGNDCSTRLPFARTRHIRNSFNGNREIKVSRDGELPFVRFPSSELSSRYLLTLQVLRLSPRRVKLSSTNSTDSSSLLKPRLLRPRRLCLVDLDLVSPSILSSHPRSHISFIESWALFPTDPLPPSKKRLIAPSKKKRGKLDPEYSLQPRSSLSPVLPKPSLPLSPVSFPVSPLLYLVLFNLALSLEPRPLPLPLFDRYPISP